jgi:oligopeptide/dipeptide ABC transporter ATP-binding protein
MVMYAGKVVEQAPVQEFFTRPSHPYTLGLLASRPSLSGGEDIPTIPGNVPDLIHRPSGRPFHPRCRWATQECIDIEPLPREIGPRHTAACHHLEEVQRDIAATH